MKSPVDFQKFTENYLNVEQRLRFRGGLGVDDFSDEELGERIHDFLTDDEKRRRFFGRILKNRREYLTCLRASKDSSEEMRCMGRYTFEQRV